MSRTRLGFIGPSAAYPGFSPKIQGAAPATGAISVDGVENYIGGSATLSAVSGSVDMGTLGGSISGSVIGGTIS